MLGNFHLYEASETLPVICSVTAVKFTVGLWTCTSDCVQLFITTNASEIETAIWIHLHSL